MGFRFGPLHFTRSFPQVRLTEDQRLAKLEEVERLASVALTHPYVSRRETLEAIAEVVRER